MGQWRQPPEGLAHFSIFRIRIHLLKLIDENVMFTSVLGLVSSRPEFADS